jgi:hypothetical protein
MAKPKLATTSLAGCFGCHMSLLDIDERILELAEIVDFDKSPIDDIKNFTGRCAIGLIEGGCAHRDDLAVALLASHPEAERDGIAEEEEPDRAGGLRPDRSGPQAEGVRLHVRGAPESARDPGAHDPEEFRIEPQEGGPRVRIEVALLQGDERIVAPLEAECPLPRPVEKGRAKEVEGDLEQHEQGERDADPREELAAPGREPTGGREGAGSRGRRRLRS